MRKAVFFLLILVGVLGASCRNDFSFQPSQGNLKFSKQTVYLDTVFTNIGSSTYRLKVYNQSDTDISIPSINLQKGASSKFRLMVDGRSGDGKSFQNVELLANDSLYLFIETTADIASANPTDFLYTDKIEFHSAVAPPQTVDLVTLVQDAYFIFPQRSGTAGNYSFESINLGLDPTNQQIQYIGSNLSRTDPVNGNELHLTNQKPYVVYGYAFVPNNETLIIDKGARVFFHANSGLIIPQSASFQINGANPPAAAPESLVNEVVFEGDRLEPQFSDVPGQWGAIVNYSESAANTINHLTIKNATVGILNDQRLLTDAYTPKLTITNSQIYNCSNLGLLGRGAQISGQNVVINNCGQASFAGTYGGTYNFVHCTFNNSWNNSKQLAVFLSNFLETPTTIYLKNLSQANFTNCIIYGSNQVEMGFDIKQAALFSPKFINCLIKFNNVGTALATNPEYQFDTTPSRYQNVFIAQNSSSLNPKYVNSTKNKLQLAQQWNVVAMPVAAGFIFNDIIGTPRSGSIALGAYQYVP